MVQHYCDEYQSLYYRHFGLSLYVFEPNILSLSHTHTYTQDMMPFRLQQAPPTIQRGKKASIQQLHDDDFDDPNESLESLMIPDTSTTTPVTSYHGMSNHGARHPEDNHDEATATFMDPTTTTTPTTTSTTTGRRTSTSSHQPRHHRFRWLVERMVSNPFLSVFVCDGDRSSASPSLSLSPSSSFLSNPQHQQRQHPYSRSNSHYWKSTLQNQAPQWIVQTMKQFPYQSRIQRMGCSTLRDLAKDSWPMKQQIVEQVAGVECIIKAMRNHTRDALVQELALECLYELVAGNLPEQLVEKGVVGMVLQTIENHMDEEEVIIMACNVLLALTDHGPCSVECLRHKLGGVILAKLEYSFRGRNGEISKKASELLRRLYL